MLASEQILKFILAVILGGLIGIEREINHKPAGLRTHILVCLSTTMATILSIYYFPQDPARITAAVITGIGFLGAGAIIASGRTSTHGLTTAATVWTTAIIGIAIGASAYFMAIIATLMTITVLYVAHFRNKKIKNKKSLFKFI